MGLSPLTLLVILINFNRVVYCGAPFLPVAGEHSQGLVVLSIVSSPLRGLRLGLEHAATDGGTTQNGQHDPDYGGMG